jgi:rubrerythrin
MKPELILKMKEQFKAETLAYAGYEALIEHIDDEYLEEALEEIMYDEYLHAKFLRSYMIELGNFHNRIDRCFSKKGNSAGA